MGNKKLTKNKVIDIIHEEFCNEGHTKNCLRTLLKVRDDIIKL